MDLNADASTSALLADVGESLKHGLLPVQVFSDPGLYELELRQIFGKCWVFIGHESEIPKPGDFALRYIAEDAFIFARGDDNEIRVFFNACRHRGSQFCRTEMGNTREFSCPYHGWTYSNTGDLLGVPARREGYKALDFAQWGLFKARVSNYCGMIFANLDDDAPDLETYLGDYKWYLDIQLKLTEGGMEVLGEPHRWVVEANWKQGAENFCGDSSHTQVAHRSALETGVTNSATAGAPGSTFGFQIHECSGHAVSIRQKGPGSRVFWEYPDDVVDKFASHRLSEAQFDLAARGMAHVGTVFPNFSFLHTGLTDSAERPAAGYFSIRMWQPRGPRHTEIWNWVLAPKEASDAFKERAYELGMSSFSPSGSFEQDDVAIWPGIMRSATSLFARKKAMKLNYQMGLGEMSDFEPARDWSGPGTAVPSNAGEGGLRTFHRTWYQKMVEP
jgi:phenylpropionate dioxygenase-like ring-hydroxylating dioxygenase large terminal subunit